jgi:hypothetical protein
MHKWLRPAAFVVVAVAWSSSAGAAYAAGGAGCIGLTCSASAGGLAGHAQHTWSATTVLGPRALRAQRTAGFYEFGQGTRLAEKAIAYVIPPGQLDRAPAAIKALPVVRDTAPGDFATGTVIVVGTGVAAWVPADGIARATSRAAERPRARAADVDPYGCPDQYFCVYENASFTGTRVQIHAISSNGVWAQLTDFGFNDRASSQRNRRDRDSWLAENISGGGERHCYDSHSSDASFGTFNDKASSTYNSPGDGSCI